jgi:hypothetical protein
MSFEAVLKEICINFAVTYLSFGIYIVDTSSIMKPLSTRNYLRTETKTRGVPYKNNCDKH